MAEEPNRTRILFKKALPGTGRQFSKQRIRTGWKKLMERGRKELLPELANLRGDSFGRFRRQFQELVTSHEDERTISQFRDDLQRLWRGTGIERGVILNQWVYHCRAAHPLTWVVTSWADGTYSVEPNYTVLPLALALACGEWMPKMAVCGNHTCPNPYFLKGRKTQRFCDLPACIAYGQREHKLGWWHRVGAKRRAERVKIQSKRKRKEGKRK